MPQGYRMKGVRDMSNRNPPDMNAVVVFFAPAICDLVRLNQYASAIPTMTADANQPDRWPRCMSFAEAAIGKAAGKCAHSFMLNV
jgi:hypothetical protein